MYYNLFTPHKVYLISNLLLFRYLCGIAYKQVLFIDNPQIKPEYLQCFTVFLIDFGKAFRFSVLFSSFAILYDFLPRSKLCLELGRVLTLCIAKLICHCAKLWYNLNFPTPYEDLQRSVLSFFPRRGFCGVRSLPSGVVILLCKD